MNITTFLKQQEIISVRDFLHGFAKITTRPKRKLYTVVKNGKKVGTYIPELFEDEYYKSLTPPPPEEKKYSSFFDNYDKIAFNDGAPDLSQRMDDILYGKV